MFSLKRLRQFLPSRGETGSIKGPAYMPVKHEDDHNEQARVPFADRLYFSRLTQRTAWNYRDLKGATTLGHLAFLVQSRPLSRLGNLPCFCLQAVSQYVPVASEAGFRVLYVLFIVGRTG